MNWPPALSEAVIQDQPRSAGESSHTICSNILCQTILEIVFFGSQAVILPQVFRPAAVRREADPRFDSWRPSQNGH